ncbi:hypothetical protein NMY22_g19684 [Coprinellus aureogranulatus]|nr:hypothetical protein NMY22_g19684 [Coprinellus aureogranulatus]
MTVPSPTSQTPPSPNRDAEGSDSRTINGYDDDRRTEKTEDTRSRSGDWKVHSVASEPNLRHAASANQEPPPPVPPLPGNDGRRSVVGISREKSLPPIPLDEAPAVPTMADRPMTMYTYDPSYDPRTLPPGVRAPHDFLPPNAAFRTADNRDRRQSFNGTASRPQMSQTLPPFSIRQPPSFSPQYDEFGRSRGSFNPVDHLDDDRLRAVSPQPTGTAKRKSKFGFASLLGKKSTKESENSTHYGAQPFPMMQSTYDAGTHATRMSVASRKPLDELVAQDPEFVAYRYPSTEQRLDLLK